MTEICKNWSEWLKKTRFSYMDENQVTQTLNWLGLVKDAVLENAEIKQNDTIIDLGTGTGLLGFGALELVGKEGKVIFSDKFEDCLSECKKLLETMYIQPQYDFLECGCEDIKLAKDSVDKALMRSVLVHILDKQQAINEIYRILKPNGIFSAFEPVMKSNTRYYEILNPSNISFYEDFKKAEMEFMSSDMNPLTNFDQDSIAQNLESAGFKDARIDVQTAQSRYIMQPSIIETSFDAPPSPGAASMRQNFLNYFEEAKVNEFVKEIKADLSEKEVTINTNTILITAIKN